jgi:hypothetical protein
MIESTILVMGMLLGGMITLFLIMMNEKENK